MTVVNDYINQNFHRVEVEALGTFGVCEFIEVAVEKNKIKVSLRVHEHSTCLSFESQINSTINQSIL